MTLNLQTTIKLGRIIDAAQRGVKVAKLLDNGNVWYGVARSVGQDGDSGFAFARADDDVRDLFLRVSGTMEASWAVRDLLAGLDTEYFLDVS